MLRIGAVQRVLIHDRPVMVRVRDLSAWVEDVGYVLFMLEMGREGPQDIHRLRRVVSLMGSILQPAVMQHFEEMNRYPFG